MTVDPEWAAQELDALNAELAAEREAHAATHQALTDGLAILNSNLDDWAKVQSARAVLGDA